MKSDKVAIYGAGGHGRVVAEVAVACGLAIEFIDDNSKEFPDFSTFVKRYGSEIPFALGIGDNALRRQIFERIQREGIPLKTLIHPTAIISPTAELGTGTVVMPGVIVNASARIDRGVILNSGCIVEHDCRIGDFVHLSPGVALAGSVSIGPESHLGIGASVIQGIRIGEKTIVGAGASVVDTLPDKVTAAGVPARIIRRNHG